MPNSGQPPNQKFDAQDELDYLFANASPNPNREGCPSRDELVRVARLETPMGDAAYAHIVRCSPCFREMRALQRARGPARSAREWAVAAAAALALVVGGWWLLRPANTPSLVAITIDLRPYSVTRGDTPPPTTPALAIPRARIDATILLPLGAQPGSYELQLRDESTSVRVATMGVAEVKESLTTLHALLDTTNLSVGSYQLEVRPGGGDWRRVPARLQ